jgi:hypothetical protein
MHACHCSYSLVLVAFLHPDSETNRRSNMLADNPRLGCHLWQRDGTLCSVLCCPCPLAALNAESLQALVPPLGIILCLKLRNRNSGILLLNSPATIPPTAQSFLWELNKPQLESFGLRCIGRSCSCDCEPFFVSLFWPKRTIVCLHFVFKR